MKASYAVMFFKMSVSKFFLSSGIEMMLFKNKVFSFVVGAFRINNV